MKKYNLRLYGTGYGINRHTIFIDDISGLIITSNDDFISSEKWYMTNGEGSDTVFYKSPTEAMKAFLKLGEKAIRK